MSRDTTQCQLSGQCTQCGLRPRRVWPTLSRATDSGWYCLACWTEFTGLPPRPQGPTHELLMRISGGNAPFYQEGYQQQSIAQEISFYTAELARLLDARGADCAVIEAMADSANFFQKVTPMLQREFVIFLSQSHPTLVTLLQGEGCCAEPQLPPPALLPKWFRDQVDHVYAYAARHTELGRASDEAIASLDTPLRCHTPSQRADCYGGLSITNDWLRATENAFCVKDDSMSSTMFDLGNGTFASWRVICEAPPSNPVLKNLLKRVTKKGVSLGEDSKASVPEFAAFLQAFVTARMNQATMCPIFRGAMKFDMWVTQTLTRLGILDMILKQTQATAASGRNKSASGKEMEVESLSDQTVEELTECERAVIAHACAVTPRDEIGRLVWPSTEEQETGCLWFLQCRQAVREGNIEGFTAHCNETGRPFWAILRNIKWEFTAGLSGELDGLLVDLRVGSVISVIEIKNSPVELPNSRQQRERLLKGLLQSLSNSSTGKTQTITFKGEMMAHERFITGSSFTAFLENPVVRWLHVCPSDLAPWQSSVRGGISWFILQEFGTLLGASGYTSTGSAEEKAAAVKQAVSYENICIFRKKMHGIWKNRFEGKEGMIAPLCVVNECVLLGGWNIALLTSAVKS